MEMGMLTKGGGGVEKKHPRERSRIVNFGIVVSAKSGNVSADGGSDEKWPCREGGNYLVAW